jgi:hypothetical protein
MGYRASVGATKTRAVIAKATVAVGGEDIVREGPIEVRIELEKTSYKLGEPLRFTFTANQDCYFLVYTIDPNDQVEVRDPAGSEAYIGRPLCSKPASGAPFPCRTPLTGLSSPRRRVPTRSVRFADATSWRCSD